MSYTRGCPSLTHTHTRAHKCLNTPIHVYADTVYTKIHGHGNTCVHAHTSAGRGGMEIKTVRRRSLTGLIAPARTPPLRRSGRLAVVSSPAHYTEAKTRCAIFTVSAAARRYRYPRTVQCYHTETPPPTRLVLCRAYIFRSFSFSIFVFSPSFF